VYKSPEQNRMARVRLKQSNPRSNKKPTKSQNTMPQIFTRFSAILATILATTAITATTATKTISYKQSSIFAHLPLTLNNNERGFLLGLNNSIALVSIDGSIKSEYHWKADAETIDICHSVIRESITECHNLVYIIQPYKKISEKIESYLACGSYASQTKCITLFIKNRRHIVN